jgi:hypothetical protein
MTSNEQMPLDDYDKSFWIRLFSLSPTPLFDIFFGLVVPIAVLAFDPGIFRPNCYGPGRLAPYASFSYTFIALEMLTLVFWLSYYDHIKRGLSMIAGVFFIGSLFALIPTLGLIIFGGPVIITIVCLGLAEFIPCLLAFVYLRNGIRALRRRKRLHPTRSTKTAILLIFTGMLLVLIVPAWVQQNTLYDPQAATKLSCPRYPSSQ